MLPDLDRQRTVPATRVHENHCLLHAELGLGHFGVECPVQFHVLEPHHHRGRFVRWFARVDLSESPRLALFQAGMLFEAPSRLDYLQSLHCYLLNPESGCNDADCSRVSD